MSVKLVLQDDQAHVLVAALELMFRVGLGQVDELLGFLPQAMDARGEPLDLTPEDRTYLRELLLEVRRSMGLSEGTSWGIHSPAVQNHVKAAYDLRCMLRDLLALGPQGTPAIWQGSVRHVGPLPGVAAEWFPDTPKED